MRTLFALAFALLVTWTASPANADVTSLDAQGFVSRNEVAVAISPEDAYSVMITPSAWWGNDHTYSGDAANFTLNATAGGCLCEALPNGGFVEHLRVVYAHPGTELRFSGGLGPLQTQGVAGAMRWSIAPSENGATIAFEYAVGGHIKEGFDAWAPAVDTMLAGQLNQLKALIEGSEQPR